MIVRALAASIGPAFRGGRPSSGTVASLHRGVLRGTCRFLHGLFRDSAIGASFRAGLEDPIFLGLQIVGIALVLVLLSVDWSALAGERAGDPPGKAGAIGRAADGTELFGPYVT